MAVYVDVALVGCVAGSNGVCSRINFSIPCPGSPGLYVSLRTLVMAVKCLTESSWLYWPLDVFGRFRRLMASRTCVLVDARAV